MRVDLSRYDNSSFNPGRGSLVRALWYFANVLLLQNPLNPLSSLKVLLLRIFGAKVGKGVVLKPSINVKYPWNLRIGDHCWIGEGAWLDSLAPITIGSHACISQGSYLCTGNHDWSDPAFGLIVKPIVVEDGVWIGARALVVPGVTLGSHSVVAAGSVVAGDTESRMIYAGNPALALKERKVDAAPRSCNGLD